MTARTAETAGGGERNGEGLRGSPINAPTQGISRDIMARKRPAPPSIGQEQCLPLPGSAVESPERPTVVVAQSPSGKSRFIPPNLQRRKGESDS